MSQFEQRANIKLCFKLGKTAEETLECLKTVYGDEALKKTAVYDWFKRFKNGQESLKDEERSGRPSTLKNDETIEKVKNLVRSDRRLRIQDMANALGISYGSVQNILKDDLGMGRVCAKFVPRILTEDQMENRKLIAAELFKRSVNEKDFLSKIVTGDETWVMLIVFFDNEGLVHWEFVPNGQTVNSSFYIEVLKRLRDSIRRKRQRKWENGWFLHHDNAPCHSSFAVRQFLTDKKISTIPQPPYSPDIAPCDFWLFPNLKIGLKGERFATIEDIKVNATANLRAIPIEGYQRCFQQLQSRWNSKNERKVPSIIIKRTNKNEDNVDLDRHTTHNSDNEFRSPRRTSKIYDSPTKKLFTTPNRYFILDNNNTNDQEMFSFNDNTLPITQTDIQKNHPIQSQSTEDTPKINPLFILNITQYSQFHNEITKIISNEFTSTSKYDKIKINLETVDDFRTLAKYLDEKKYDYYTYRLKSEKDISAIIRNLPMSITEFEVMEVLKILEYPVKSVTRLTNKYKIPTLLMAVQLMNHHKSQEIFKLSKLLNCIVITELRQKSKDPFRMYKLSKIWTFTQDL
ncbi:hypothetical protein QTP88_025819 [Uroleucon formosanum]